MKSECVLTGFKPSRGLKSGSDFSIRSGRKSKAFLGGGMRSRLAAARPALASPNATGAVVGTESVGPLADAV